MSERRNVLFVTGDQWRGDWLCGRPQRSLSTPNLAALASEGMGFSRHYSQACPCGPARASLLTGLYPHNHRSIRNGTPLDARHSNLALEARRAGFDPMLFGYTDSSADPRGRNPEDPALRTYQGVLPGFSAGCVINDDQAWSWVGHLQRQGYSVSRAPLGVYRPPPGSEVPYGQGHSAATPCYRAQDSDTAFLTDRVLDYLGAQDGAPWFVHLSYLRPHPPWYVPSPYNRMYSPNDMPAVIRADSVAQEAGQHPYLAHWLEAQNRPGVQMGHPHNLQRASAHEIRQLRATYSGLISEVDHHLGRVLDHLRQSGQWDHTLVVFTADHGEMLGDHWLFGKGGYFDASYHVPLIIREPNRPAHHGKRVDAFTEAVDVMPTVLDWLGIQVPIACDGRSLGPLLAGEMPDRWRKEVHWAFDFRDPVTQSAEAALGLSSDQCGLNVIRDASFKYVHFTALPALLFDLRQDPDEFHNLAKDPAHREQMLHYAQKLLSWRMEHEERVLSNTLLTADGPVTQRFPRV